MGMDCMGDNPSCERGEYFRANIWSWCPIHHLICHFCDQHAEVFDTTLIDDETLSKMSVNDGEGPSDEKTCQILADYFDTYIEKEMEGDVTECKYGPRCCSETNRFLSEEEADKTTATYWAYRVEREHLKEFVGFLRSCGGFRVF